MGNLISLCLSAITTVLAVNDKNFFFYLMVFMMLQPFHKDNQYGFNQNK